MKSYKEFFVEVNKENGSNYKLEVLKKYQSPLLAEILKMAYDRVTYVYGISLKTLDAYPDQPGIIKDLDISGALEELKFLSSRELTGHAALKHIKIVENSLDDFDRDLLRKIIDRDLKINMGTTQINKVFKNLIVKPVYMRCSTYSEKAAKKIEYPAIVQLKADGSYREFTVSGNEVQSMSRSGEPYEYPVIFNQLKDLDDGVYIGELVVKASQELLESLGNDEKILDLIEKFKKNPDLILPREIGNGLINSHNVPHDNVILQLWDYVTLEEYDRARNKLKNHRQYIDRFKHVQSINLPNVVCINYVIVDNLSEALQYTSSVMNQGFEGAILKNLSSVFRDGTSTEQLKLKLVITAEMRVTGFTEGTGKNAEYFGAMTFENDEGTIKGRVGVTSMTEKLRDEIHANRENVIGKVFEVEFNDITRAEGNDFWAFSHPRFIEFRTDKDETDTLEKVFELKEMAMNLG